SLSSLSTSLSRQRPSRRLFENSLLVLYLALPQLSKCVRRLGIRGPFSRIWPGELVGFSGNSRNFCCESRKMGRSFRQQRKMLRLERQKVEAVLPLLACCGL